MKTAEEIGEKGKGMNCPKCGAEEASRDGSISRIQFFCNSFFRNGHFYQDYFCALRCANIRITELESQLAAEKEARVKAEKKNQIQVACSACQNCTLGFQPKHMRDGLCIDCIRTTKETAEARVKELEALKQIAEGILDRIEPSTLDRGFNSVSIRTLCGDVKNYYRRQEPMK